MTSPSARSSARNVDRYGKPLVSPRSARLLVILGAVLFLAAVVFVGLRFADQPVKSEVISYEHIDEHLVGVDFQVSMTPGTAATCTLQALNEGSAQVGFVEVDIEAQSERRTAHHVEIATQGDAVTAEVIDCEVG